MDIADGHYLEIMRRSVLGLVSVYNVLPESVVEATSVACFQSRPQELLKTRVEAGCEDWPLTFSPRIERWRPPR